MRPRSFAWLACLLLSIPLTATASTTASGRWATTYLSFSYSDLQQDGPRRTTDAMLVQDGGAWSVVDPYESFGCDDGTHVWYEYEGVRIHGTGACSLATGADGTIHASWSAPAVAAFLPDHDPLVLSYGWGEGDFR